jgi:hypothetical protein
MRQDRLNGQLAGYFAVGLPAHAIREHIQLQRIIDRVAILVVFSDASEVGARAGLDMQMGPHAAGGEI